MNISFPKPKTPQGDRKHVRVRRRQFGRNTSSVVISFRNRQSHVLCCASVYIPAEERYTKYRACMLHILCTDGVGRRTCTNVQSKTVDLRYLYQNSGFEASELVLQDCCCELLPLLPLLFPWSFLFCERLHRVRHNACVFPVSFTHTSLAYALRTSARTSFLLPYPRIADFSFQENGPLRSRENDSKTWRASGTWIHLVPGIFHFTLTRAALAGSMMPELARPMTIRARL